MNRSIQLLCFHSSRLHILLNHTRRLNHYNTLGVDKTASEEELKKAYIALSKKYHPDLQNEQDLDMAVENFIKIQKAYDILGDTNLRKEYDKQYSSSKLHPHEEKISNEEIRDILRRQAARKASAESTRTETQSTDGHSSDHNPIIELDRPPIFRLLNYLYFAIVLLGGSMVYLGMQKNMEKEDCDSKKDTRQ